MRTLTRSTRRRRTPVWQAPLVGLAGLAVVGAVAAARAVALLRPRQRILHPMEAIETPEVVRAYDRIARLPQMRALYAWAARRALREKRFKRALDVGCGPGWLDVELVKRQPGLAMVGVDASPEMLDLARRNVAASGLDAGVLFQQGRAEDLPFPDDAFDLVVSTLALHHWQDPLAALNQVQRVLQPGGRFVIFDIQRDLPGPAWLSLWLARTFLFPSGIRDTDEPLTSARAAYTPNELPSLAEQSNLHGWRVSSGPAGVVLESKA